jgi:hypothetical protein
VTGSRKPSRSSHHRQTPKRKVTARPKKVTREGAVILGFSLKQIDTMNMLLEPGVRTYADAAKRFATTEGAIKARMSRAGAQVHRANGVINEWRKFKDARREKRRAEKR